MIGRTWANAWRIGIGLLLAGCGTLDERPGTSSVKARILALAESEWIRFGGQTILFDGDQERMPRVGHWEDEPAYAARVNQYWRAVGSPQLTGMDCQEPWSAAFVSWVMGTAGVSRDQFTPSAAHWVYLEDIVRKAGPGRALLPRTPSLYQPRPGDLVCAARETTEVPPELARWESFAHRKLHCDIVVASGGGRLEVIGGNARNSVSRTILRLDHAGYLAPSPRRPWFMVVENRL